MASLAPTRSSPAPGKQALTDAVDLLPPAAGGSAQVQRKEKLPDQHAGRAPAGHDTPAGHAGAHGAEHEAEADDSEQQTPATVPLVAGKPPGPVQRRPIVDPPAPTGPRPLTIADATERYAPLVYLAPGESNRPADANDFIHNSRLRWSHDTGATDDEIADKGHVDPYKLGHGGYSDQVENIFGDKHGDPIRSNQNCRPNDGSGDGGDEGFFLDLDNSQRPSTGTGTNMPVYYEAVAGHYITYWFFYKFNAGPGPGPIDDHEGDWERISVRLNADNRATQVAYYEHTGDKVYNWRDVPKQGTHPIVYSAKGSHASYATPGEHGTDAPGVNDTTGKGAQWKTWQRLQNARAQGWYGYGGAWGEVGTKNFITDTTGPQGPSKYKPPAPKGW